MEYRPEIDGLRALAVCAVVLFHFNVAALSGGFVGVDIFFVISGYLITHIIAREIEQGTFTFRAFYARRARRILPASIVLVSAVAVWGWAALPSTDLIVLGKSVIAVTVFGSNFFMAGQADYFGAEASTIHLLHTWSLAVEEQFYFLFPLLLVVLRHRMRSRGFWVLVSVAAISFAASAFGTSREPAFAFYLLPTRAWELLAGALIAIKPLRAPRGWAGALTTLGLAMMVGAIVGFDDTTQIPGTAVLLPVLGAVLVIGCAPQAPSGVRRILSNPVAVFLGKISYSLYLWHWPLIVAYRHSYQGPLAWAPVLFLPLLAISYASYRWVEQPFRQPGRLSVKLKAGLALATQSLLLGYGITAVRSHGMAFGLDDQQLQIAEAPKQGGRAEIFGGSCFKYVPWEEFDRAGCLTAQPGKKNVLLWGDSVAAHFSYGLRKLAQGTDIEILQVTAAGCSPSLGRDPKPRPLCLGRNDAVLEWIRQNPPDLIVLGGEWTWKDNPKVYRRPLGRTLTALQELNIPRLLLGTPIQYDRPLPELLLKASRKHRPLDTSKVLNDWSKKIDQEMKEGVVPLQGAQLVSIYDLLCDGWKCPTITPEGVPMIVDTHHFSKEGSLLAAKKLFPVIEAALENRPH
jgi:peptidoglycan/LPS O-acetylase OafA/YrhL